MGGFGSGRHGGRPTTEQGLTLDMSRCLKKGIFRAGQGVQGTTSWTNTITGQVTATVSYQADMRDPVNAWLRLEYSTTDRGTGERRQQDQWITLVTTRPHFGGVRWWFRCPLSGRRVRCLHHDGSNLVFGSRQALRLGYGCQRESLQNRRLRAAQTADAKLGGNGNLFDPNPPKPKWMRWPTYRRLCVERQDAILRSLVSVCMALGQQELGDRLTEDEPNLLTTSRRKGRS